MQCQNFPKKCHSSISFAFDNVSHQGQQRSTTTTWIASLEKTTTVMTFDAAPDAATAEKEYEEVTQTLSYPSWTSCICLDHGGDHRPPVLENQINPPEN
jgi:hypothetical protein